MGGWKFKVEKRRVKIKAEVCEVIAFSQEQAVEFAKEMDCWDAGMVFTGHTEYVAREVS